MTFVPGLSHDIFLSYTHLDDEPDEQDVRWVSAFRAHLETGLRQRLGGEVSIFFDLSHLKAQNELEYLLENVRESAVFLPVFSPNYGLRPWTMDELDAFDKAAKSASPAIAAINRIVAVEVLPVEEDAIPARLRNLKRTRFYYEDKVTKTSHKLTATRENKVDGKRITDIYGERIGELTCNLVELLRDLKKRLKSEDKEIVLDRKVPEKRENDPAIRSPIKGKVILVAQATDDLYDETQKVRTYLEQFGGKLLPEGDYPLSGPEFAAAFRADLAQADLFVQLLSGSPSRIPTGLRQSEREPQQSYSWFQYEAAKRREVPIPVLQWHEPRINAELIKHHDKQLLSGPDVRVMSLQEFMKEIQATVGQEEERRRKEEERRRKTEQAQLAIGGGQDDESFFFINAYSDDLGLANMLAGAFKARRRTAFLPPTYKGSAKEVDEDIDESLINCSGLLLVFGEAPAHWVRAQLRRYFKVAPRREKAPRYKKILFAPGAQPDEIGVATNFDEIDCRDGATSDRIQQLVSELCLS